MPELLEIYANRKSLKQFETLASELYAKPVAVVLLGESCRDGRNGA